MRNNIDLSADQHSAVMAIEEWRDDWPNGPQIFTMGGFAGCGKTTVVCHLADRLPRAVVAAPTGKAVHVLRDSVDATTIHSLMYSATIHNGKLRFTKKPTIDAQTIIIDEASMCSSEILNDLLSYNLPILFVGDHGQLEPIGDNPNLMQNPDVKLEKIHRQAEGNPILRLSAAFRECREQQVWDSMRDKGWYQSKDRRVTVASKRWYKDLVTDDMTVVVGFNETRHKINREVREKAGYKEPICQGEKFICLQNNSTWGTFNGQILICIGIEDIGRKHAKLLLMTDGGETLFAPILMEQLGKNKLVESKDKKVLLLDYGYCLTAHKMQGSQADSVAVIEEIHSSWNAARWRYTVVTRAVERLVYLV